MGSTEVGSTEAIGPPSTCSARPSSPVPRGLRRPADQAHRGLRGEGIFGEYGVDSGGYGVGKRFHSHRPRRGQRYSKWRSGRCRDGGPSVLNLAIPTSVPGVPSELEPPGYLGRSSGLRCCRPRPAEKLPRTSSALRYLRPSGAPGPASPRTPRPGSPAAARAATLCLRGRAVPAGSLRQNAQARDRGD